VLAGAVLGLSSLAGCVGGQGSGGPSETATPSPDSDRVFERVAVEGTTLVIDLAEDADIDTVNVISPSGELYRRLAVYRGVTRLSTEIDETYTPGTHEVLGIRQSQSVSSVQLEIAPQLEITGVSLASEGTVAFPEKLGTTIDAQVAVSISNTGTGPAYIRKLLILGDVPKPTVGIADPRSTKSGILETITQRFDAEQVTLHDGEAGVLFTNSIPFSTTRRDQFCNSEVYTGDVEVQLIGPKQSVLATTIYSVRYSTSDSSASCTIELIGGR
jgi:hypothetical protein